MFFYTVGVAIVAVVAYILIALCTKKAEGVEYGKMDKAGQITNAILTIVYVCLSPLCLFLGIIARPGYREGFLCIIGWILSFIVASPLLVCGIGLGLSVAFRKKGKSKLSFIVQFAGLGGIAIMLILFFCFYGNLLAYLN